ncbi:MAG: hypothetical protein AAFX99_33285, partial [Myxococcota bacterium]
MVPSSTPSMLWIYPSLVLGAVGFMLCGGLLPKAHANLAAATHHPAATSPPSALSPTPLTVGREQLTIDCREVNHTPRCTFEARYTIHNPTDTSQTVD